MKKDAAKSSFDPGLVNLKSTAAAQAHQYITDDVALDYQSLEYLKKSISQNTRRAYESDWKIFRAWCESRGFNFLPATPNTVCNFIAAQASQKEPALSVTTIKRRLAAIRLSHLRDGLEYSPTTATVVKKTMEGIAKVKLMRQTSKEPTTDDIIFRMVDLIDTSTLSGLRNRALLLLGFYGAFRRSELVAVKVEDLKVKPEGMDVYMPKSKTDQMGEGDVKPIIRADKYCAIKAVYDWLDAAGIAEGFVFRSFNKKGELREPKSDHYGLYPQVVAEIVKKYTALLGLDESKYAGHSLRHGFSTTAVESGATIGKLMSVTNQKTPNMAMRYYKDLDRYKNHAAENFKK